MHKAYRIFLPLCLSILVISGCIRNPIESNETKEEIVEQLSEEELKDQLAQKECANPQDYIHGELGWEGKYKHALSMKINRLAVSCKIRNQASIVTYKDVKCVIRFLSKTNSVVLEHEFLVYEFIQPNRSVDYSTEIDITNQQFKDIADTEWFIKDAGCK